MLVLSLIHKSTEAKARQTSKRSVSPPLALLIIAGVFKRGEASLFYVFPLSPIYRGEGD
jgi:hypothetical protein